MDEPISGNQTASQRLDWLIWLGIGLLTLAAGALRFYDLDRLGFRIDEGFTLTYSRQSWPDVLGLQGFYSPHPPLYFSLAKLANIFTPETIASRTVSALVGTATIPIFFAVCRRAGETGIAFGAATLLAISPLHLEYSRDGRMYTLVLFLIAIAWLAYISYQKGGDRVWLPVLSMSLAAAFYADYSAAYAAAPLALAIIITTLREPAKGRWLVLASGASLFLYLPWIPQIVETVDKSRNAFRRADYLGASWERIWDSVPVLLGFDRWTLGPEASFANSWYRWSDYRLLLFIPVAIALVIAIHRRTPVSGLVALGLLIALTTPIAAIGLSLVSPGYAARTVMAAVLGWSILASSAFARQPMARLVRATGFVAWVALAGLQVLSLPAVYEVQGRGEWPEIAQDLTTLEPLEQPVLVFSTAGTLTDMLDLYGYAPSADSSSRVVTLLDGVRETWTGADGWLDRGITLEQIGNGALADVLTNGDGLNDAIWVIIRFGGDRVFEYLADLGYEPVGILRYPDTKLYLYALPNATIGSTVEVDRQFVESGDPLSGWAITDSRTEVQTESVYSTPAETIAMIETRGSATFRFSVHSAGLVSLDVDVRGPDGVALAAIDCMSASSESLLRTTRRYSTFPAVYNSETWRRVRLSVFCPTGTETVEIILYRAGEFEAAFANPRVQFAPLNEAQPAE